MRIALSKLTCRASRRAPLSCILAADPLLERIKRASRWGHSVRPEPLREITTGSEGKPLRLLLRPIFLSLSARRETTDGIPAEPRGPQLSYHRLPLLMRGMLAYPVIHAGQQAQIHARLTARTSTGYHFGTRVAVLHQTT